jgi:Tol biopolymer transport system component
MCACPTLLTNGDVIYCAGGKIKQWCAQEGKSKALTEQGYCTGPAYHEETQQVVFSQKVGKRMQLFVLHVRSGKSQQLTFDDGDKIDPSWSPCGTYIVYCLKKDKTSEIVVFNTVTKRHERITASGDYCSCPSWSPVLRS